jgi:hypothetical protein
MRSVLDLDVDGLAQSEPAKPCEMRRLPLNETETAAGEDFQPCTITMGACAFYDEANIPFRHPRSTNLRDVDGPSPIRHANPDRRTHTRAVPHRKDIHEPPLAAALQ